MLASVGVTLKVIFLLSWHRNENASAVRVMFTNQPAPNALSSAAGPPLTVGTTTSAVGAGGCVGGTAVGGIAVGGGTSVGAWVGTTVTTTVSTITSGVAVG